MRISLFKPFVFTFHLIPILAFSQKEDTIYFDDRWQICKKEIASYYRYGTVIIDSFAYYTGKVQDHYMTGALEMEGMYSRDGYKEGVFNFYYPNGNLEATGNFTRGVLYGSWTYYYSNGSKKAKIYYAGDVNSFIVLDYVDSSGNVLSKDGTGKFQIAAYDNMNRRLCKLQGEFKNGKREGTWTFYSNESYDGKKLYEETYENGKFKEGQYAPTTIRYNTPRTFEDALCFNKFSYTETFVASRLSFGGNIVPDPIHENTRDTVGAIREPEVAASFVGGEGAWKRFLESNLKGEVIRHDVAAKLASFTYTVWVEFVVCVDGVVCEIRAISVFPSAGKEAERVIKLSSHYWKPAIQGGKSVKSFKVQAINFAYEGGLIRCVHSNGQAH